MSCPLFLHYLFAVLSGLFMLGGFTVVCPGSFVKCPTRARLECMAQNEAMLTLSGWGCLCLSTWSSHGLLSSIINSFRVLKVGYLGRFDFYRN